MAQIDNQLESLKKRKKEIIPDFLKEKANYIFDKDPFLHSFSWKQYAPYFAYGDACIFSVNYDYVDLKFKKGEEVYPLIDSFKLYNDNLDSYSIKGLLEEAEELELDVELIKANILELSKDIISFFDYLDDDTAQELYGDDSIIEVSANGINSENYGRHD